MEIRCLPPGFSTIIKGFTHSASPLTGSTMSGLRILCSSNLSLSSKAIGVFLAGGYDRCYILIDNNVMDFRECACFTKAILTLV